MKQQKQTYQIYLEAATNFIRQCFKKLSLVNKNEQNKQLGIKSNRANQKERLYFPMLFTVVVRLLKLHSKKKRIKRKSRSIRNYTGKTDIKSFINSSVHKKAIFILDIFHFNLGVTLGENCAFAGCSSNRRQKEISLFKAVNC